MVMGPGQWHWVRQLGRPSRSDHAAGDGEPVRRHGQRAAGHADGRTYAGHANDRYEPAHYDDHVTVSGCHLSDGTAVTINGVRLAGGGLLPASNDRCEHHLHRVLLRAERALL